MNEMQKLAFEVGFSIGISKIAKPNSEEAEQFADPKNPIVLFQGGVPWRSALSQFLGVAAGGVGGAALGGMLGGNNPSAHFLGGAPGAIAGGILGNYFGDKWEDSAWENKLQDKTLREGLKNYKLMPDTEYIVNLIRNRTPSFQYSAGTNE